MMMLTGISLPEKAMRQYIANALNVIIHSARFTDGSRRVTKTTEITGMEGDTVLTQDLFEYVRTGISPVGKVLGHFRITGTRSYYAERIEAAGFKLEELLAAASLR